MGKKDTKDVIIPDASMKSNSVIKSTLTKSDEVFTRPRCYITM